ncbi:MAG TPA: shikimate kinase [Vicinamibacteria bacterium]|nr:shikimate kinase [Vicinamibacteria bacterium]
METVRLLAALGRRVRQLRAERGFSLRELSARAGLSVRFLGQVEAGQGNISVSNLAALASALSTSPAALLSDLGAGGPPVIALLGLRGAGKSTIGRRLARRLRLPFVELDRRVEEAAGLTLGELFALHGEDYYRRLERDALEGLLASGQPVVLATGGGIVNSPETYALLKRRALTIWLRARAQDHWNRVVQQGDRRPMADRPQAMAELRRILAVREPLYAEAAHTVDTSRLDAEAVAAAAAAVVLSAQA